MASSGIGQLETAADLLKTQCLPELPDVLLLEDTAELLRVQRLIDGLVNDRLALIDARGATTTEYAHGTKSWLSVEQRLSVPDAAARIRVARASSARPAVAEALRGGTSPWITRK